MVADREIKASFKKTLKRLRTIHLALMVGMLILVFLAFKLQPQPRMATPPSTNLFLYLVPMLGLTGYFTGLYLLRWLQKPLTPVNELALRLKRYQSACLLQYSCLEVPALLALFAYILEGHLFYAAIAVFLILYLFALYPSYGKMLRKMPLGRQEKHELDSMTIPN